jgi:class 3 adenylate cyclase
MFTDIVTSTDLIGLVGDDAWAELLAWHNRELRSSFASHRGVEAKSTGDGFFVAFEKAADAIECAVDIQRRLARHRREHGFAPDVRIGLHMADATARIESAASGQEILVSTDALEAAGRSRFKVSEPRALTLKGVREPVEVRAVDWR